MNKDGFKELNKKIRSKGLVMSRVPQNTRDLFVALAEEEYCEDYGLCLKGVLDGYLMWKTFFENTSMKLDVLSEKLDSLTDLVGEENKEEKPEGRKMLDGRIVQGGKNG